MATNFPQALGAQQPPQWTDPYEAARQALMARMQAPQQPMYSPEEQAARVAENKRMHDLGLLGQLSGNEQLGNVGAQVFKQALGARQPRVTERGVADPLTGKFTYGADYLRERDEQALAGLDTKSAAARASYDAERRQARDREELQRQRAEDQRELRRITAAQGQVGAFQPYGTAPDGQQVVTNTKSGVNYILKLNPDGTPQYLPYGGPVIPKATFEKSVAAVQEALSAADRADSLLQAVEENPDAFGLASAAVSTVPGPLQGYAAQAMQLSPEQMEMRARVLREAALEVNQLYGAALSVGEAARASTFIPNAADPPEAVMAKLKAARDWARSSAALQGPGVVGAANARRGAGASGSWDAPPGAPGAPPGAASAAAGGKGWAIRKKPPGGP